MSKNGTSYMQDKNKLVIIKFVQPTSVNRISATKENVEISKSRMNAPRRFDFWEVCDSKRCSVDLNGKPARFVTQLHFTLNYAWTNTFTAKKAAMVLKKNRCKEKMVHISTAFRSANWKKSLRQSCTEIRFESFLQKNVLPTSRSQLFQHFALITLLYWPEIDMAF